MPAATFAQSLTVHLDKGKEVKKVRRAFAHDGTALSEVDILEQA